MLISSHTISFNHKEYKIQLSDSFDGLADELLKLQDVSAFYIITEKKIAKLHYASLEKEMKLLGKPFHLIYMKGKEKNKHIDRLKKTYNKLIELGADRKSVIIAFGGGVVGDYSGFVAATYQRGVRFVQIPTTLLACVDSSVGGKVAVNADMGKNMIGAFHQPELVFAALPVLATLPEKEWKCGLAEVLKHSLLSGGTFFESMKSAKFEDVYDLKSLEFFISESVKYKASVVAEDERETGKRAVLNLGHTLGHAIESMTNYRKYSHGEAVSIGLVFALLLSVEKAELDREVLTSVLSIMKSCNLPTSDRKLLREEIYEHMLHDKKTSANVLKFVLLKCPGEPVWNQKIDKEEIYRTLSHHKEL